MAVDHLTPVPSTWEAEELPSVSPVDGRCLATFPVAGAAAVAAARNQLRWEAPRWAARPLADRLDALRRLRVLLAEEGEAVVDSLAVEIGRPVVEGYAAELLPTLRSLRWLERRAGSVLRPERLGRGCRQEWEPHGLIGLLSPWNYPLFCSLPVVAAALAAGNVVMWKPSELALATSDLLHRLLARAGLADQVRIMPGDGTTGQAVLEAACDKYVLIGSAATGRAVLSRLGELLRPAVAELSGCDPMVVCEDADIPLAAAAAVWGRTVGAGQTCMAPRCIFVHQGVYPAFLDWTAARLAGIRTGDPRVPATELGPVRTERLRQCALAAIDEACRDGARRLHGGCRLPGPGHYLLPALLADCRPEMRVMREDLAGPVLAVCPVKDDDEAIARANDSVHALSASVWTQDAARGRHLARQVPGGLVSVNDVILPGADPSAPFGGSRDSGYGRVRGAVGLREMVRPRVIRFGPRPGAPRRHFFPYRPGTLSILRAATVRESGLRPAWRALREMGRAIIAYQQGKEA